MPFTAQEAREIYQKAQDETLLDHVVKKIKFAAQTATKVTVEYHSRQDLENVRRELQNNSFTCSRVHEVVSRGGSDYSLTIEWD